MSEVIEPVHMGPAVVKGMYELMRYYSVHVGLLVDVVLTQNDLGEKKPNTNTVSSHRPARSATPLFLCFLPETRPRQIRR